MDFMRTPSFAYTSTPSTARRGSEDKQCGRVYSLNLTLRCTGVMSYMKTGRLPSKTKVLASTSKQNVIFTV